MKKTLLFALALVGCGADTASAPFPAANSQLSRATLFTDGKTVVKAPTAVSPFTETDGTHVMAASNQLLVSFDDQASDDEIEQALQRISDLGGVLVGDIPDTFALELEFPKGSDLVALEEQLSRLNGVIDVSLNEMVGEHLAPPSVDPVPATFNGDYWVNSINARLGWGYLVPTGTFPLVAVVDGGVNLSREAIAPSRIVARVDSQGQALTDSDSDLPIEHGTKVLSFAIGNGAAGSSNPNVGVNWGSNALVIKALGTQEEGFVFNAEAGVATALRQGARFVNVSIGPVLKTAESEDDFYRVRERFRARFGNCLEMASQRDAIICFSAGNDGAGLNQFDVKSDNSFLPPGSQQNATVWSTHALIVGANTSSNSMTTFSREGAVVHLSAPGQQIGVGRTFTGGTAFNGTSYSTPLTLGSTSALLNINPDLMACEARALILRTLTNNLSSLAGQVRQLNFGAAAQLAASLRAVPRDSKPVALRLSAGQSETRTVTLLNPAGAPAQDLGLVPIGDSENFTSISPAGYQAVPAGQSRDFQVTFRGSQRISPRDISQPFMLWGVAGQTAITYRLPVTITVVAQ